MKALLTSSGIKNSSIQGALVELLGKPIASSNALIIPTAIYPFPGGANHAWRALHNPMTELGWKSLGVLELSVLPSIDSNAWVPTVQAADALLVWGGDPLFLARWMRQSGLADLLPTLEAVYVGVSAGAIVAAPTFVETYDDPPRAADEPVQSEEFTFTPSLNRYLVTGRGLGLTDFAVIPHFEHPDHLDASRANASDWAARIPHPTYALDDESAVKVVDGEVTVVSEGEWQLF
ncbi:Type 1 glutamine amidotransferase-like domain-containing protein [Kribbella sp. NPDC056951]|uniref:Type 1 glutamine amidotransferase-like domain-containing protein n=1 Tax=Kribbella sp. NPDC056951 TaxID=3345978 RepID=UPI00362FA4FC